MPDPKLRDEAAREQIRTRLDVNMLVEAGAGSGKTECLAGRMAEVVAQGLCRVEEMVAVTFTKKAAAELRGRFRQELERRLEREPDPRLSRNLRSALAGMERMFAGTIHAFCAKLLRERPVEAGLAPGFREIEAAEDAILRRRAWREYIDAARRKGSPELSELLAAEVKLPELDRAFEMVCEYPDVVFPAGDAQLPATNPAWAALDAFWQELERLCGPIGRDKTKCPIQERMVEFRFRYRNAVRSRPAVLLRLLCMWESDKKPTAKWWPKDAGKRAGALVDAFRTNTVLPFLRAWREYLYRLAITLLEGGREHAAGQRRRNALLNFADLLLLASRLVRENVPVREALQRKHRFLFVDEFQDTDPMQLELLFLLAAEAGSGPEWRAAALRPGALFLVGDPKQSIYRFRRADIEMYQQARRRIEETGGLVVPLTTSFRSGPLICNWANAVFRQIFPAAPTVRQPGFEPLDAHGGDKPSAAGPVRLSHLDGVEQKAVLAVDADAIAAIIRAEVDGGRRHWGDFLILTRKKRSRDEDRLGVYAAALEAAGVPYEVSGSGSLLQSPHVEALVLLCYALTHPEAGIALAAVLRGPCFGLSDGELYGYRKSGGAFHLSAPVAEDAQGPVAAAIRRLQDWRGLTRSLPAGAAIEAILESSGLLARAAAASAGGGEAGKLVYAVDKLRAACESGMTLGDAATALEQVDEDDESDAPVLEPGRQDVVRLMNLHKAKGLEANVVFLADPVAGVKPRANVRIIRQGGSAFGYLAIKRAKGQFSEEPVAIPYDWDRHEQEELEFQVAEESRLLYVAATRARETLVVSEWQGKPKSVVQPWEPLKASLATRLALPVQPLPAPRAAALPDLSEAVRTDAAVARRERVESAQTPGFETFAVSSLVAHPTVPGDPADSPAGREWGTLIHGLLEYAAGSLACSAADLAGVARWLAATAALPEGMISPALETVERVRESTLWDRVRAAEERLTEVPVASLMERKAPCPTIAKGVIDLALRFPNGWEILDYKSDLASMEQLTAMYAEQVRTYAALWQAITGEPVVFAGLFSTRALQMSADLQGAATAA